jgi:hypothetical protein
MEKGYIADLTYGAALQSALTPGRPTPRRFPGGINWNKADNAPIFTCRCQRFGYLESYAPPT